MGDDSTVVLKDINKALSSSENEASSRPAALLVLGGEKSGTLFDLIEGEYEVGRSDDCPISIQGEGISRKHLKIVVSPFEDGNEQKVVISDQGSKNGTFVNDVQIKEETPLKRGDILKIGNMALKFLSRGDPERLSYEKLHNDANTDGLTKCFNKSYFNTAIEAEIKKALEKGHPLSLIIFDLDHFKKLNDNFGHDAGDYVLGELAELIRTKGVRGEDTFARYGGEEFVALLPQTNLKLAFDIADRIRKSIEEHEFTYEGQRLPVTASIGVSDLRPGVSNGTDLFKRADAALYQSKEKGRNQVNFFKE